MTGASLTVGLVQLSVGDDPRANLPATLAMIREAASAGARLVLTPEATNLLTPDRDHQARMLVPEAQDPTLSAIRALAAELGLWVQIGSLSLRRDDPADARFANRGFLIAPDGGIAARYDKIHMFDVDIGPGQSFRESAAFRPGDRAVLAQAESAILGLSICYDLRFADLYRRLAQAGAQVLTVPAAFHPQTGEAHWQVLLRARAIETGCFVLAAAQCGTHPAPYSPDRAPRRSHGHSLAVDPWGNVLADGGQDPGVVIVSLDFSAVDAARSRIPSLRHDRPFSGPEIDDRPRDTA